MKKIRSILEFIRNGFSVFSEAASGNYSSDRKDIEAMKYDVFHKNTPSVADDKRNLYQDRTLINKDIHRSFRKITSN